MNVLFVAALAEEVQGLLERAGADVVYCGVGKVNAAYRLTRALAEARALGRNVDLVVNVGSAGSSKFATHSVVECTVFLQRDMDVRPLGFQIGETPYDSSPAEIQVDKRFHDLPAGRCGTGDSFEMAGAALACDVVDMEAYALAKVCLLESVAFSSVKYITDGSDHNAHNDWVANTPKAAAAFEALYKNFLKKT